MRKRSEKTQQKPFTKLSCMQALFSWRVVCMNLHLHSLQSGVLSWKNLNMARIWRSKISSSTIRDRFQNPETCETKISRRLQQSNISTGYRIHVYETFHSIVLPFGLRPSGSPGIRTCGPGSWHRHNRPPRENPGGAGDAPRWACSHRRSCPSAAQTRLSWCCWEMVGWPGRVAGWEGGKEISGWENYETRARKAAQLKWTTIILPKTKKIWVAEETGNHEEDPEIARLLHKRISRCHNLLQSQLNLTVFALDTQESLGWEPPTITF